MRQNTFRNVFVRAREIVFVCVCNCVCERVFMCVLAYARVRECARESVLFISTQYSNLYTAVDTPAEAAWFRV